MRKNRTIAIVGGGFGGIGAATMLARAGHPDLTIFEKGERLGGVWHHNTYPGAACDVPSHLYEFSFAPKLWSRRFAAGSEIQQYLEEVARDHGVLDKVRTNTTVESARWDAERSKWVLTTSGGEHEADVVIAACGQLRTPKRPAISGLDAFDGPVFHTAEWRHDVDLADKRVAVLGTGCSAIQAVPAIADRAAHVDVYQRSPGWTMPKMDFVYSARGKRVLERFPFLRRLDRAAIAAFMDLGAAGMTQHRWLLKGFQGVGRYNINSAIKDPELRRKVTPTDEIGCKRIMLTDEWYPTLARRDVDLITDRIASVNEKGVVMADGSERPAEVLVLATGFEAHAFVAPMEIYGVEGRSLTEAWQPIPKAYLGITMSGFPNLFLMYGPNTNGGTGSVIVTIESAMAHVLGALKAMDRVDAASIELRPEAARAFDARLRAALAGTVWHSGCENWYVDEDGNDPSQWPWTWSAYRRETAVLKPADYQLA